VGREWVILLSSVLMMFCIGGVYAWSAFAYELIKGGYISVTQSQIIFGSISGGIPIYMIFAGRIEKRLISLRKFVFVVGSLFGGSYILAGLFRGNFWGIWFSLGVLSALGIGLLYALGIGIPMRWFPPQKKGLITGISVGSFGLGSVVLPFIITYLKGLGYSVHQIFMTVGVIYILLISISSLFFDKPGDPEGQSDQGLSLGKGKILSGWRFWKLWLGIFCGVFGGVMVIGNLKNMGLTLIDNEMLVTASISLFAVSNCLGRILWGWIGDRLGSPRAIVLGLLCGALGLLGLYIFSINAILYTSLVLLLGFSYGANFVLFARETAEEYGINNVTTVYPYVFLGNAVAAVCGPIVGGLLYDMYGDYYTAVLVAIFVSFLGISIFIKDIFKPIKVEG